MLKQLFGLRTRSASTLAATVVLVVLCFCSLSQTVQAQTTAFSYQGKLSEGGTPPTGQYDFTFKLFDTAGAQQGSTITSTSVNVSSGVFAVQLDFGSNFPGADRFLEIAARQHSADPNTPAFTTLSPRQAIRSTPYSIRTLLATSADSLSSACNPCVTNGQIIAVDGSKVGGVRARSRAGDRRRHAGGDAVGAGECFCASAGVSREVSRLPGWTGICRCRADHNQE